MYNVKPCDSSNEESEASDLSDDEIEVTQRLTEEQVEEKKTETFGKDNTTSTKSPRKEFSRNSEKIFAKKRLWRHFITHNEDIIL